MKEFRRRMYSSGLLLFLVIVMTMLAAVPALAAPKLNKTKAVLSTGRTLQLKVSGASGTVSWKTSDKTVAAVSSKGLVTAKKKGEAVITATADGQKLTCKVTVRYNRALCDVKPSTIDLSKSTTMTFHPQKLYYKGNDLIVKGFFANKSSKACRALKNCRVTVYGTRDGKRYTLGSSVFSGKLSVKPNVARYVTLTFRRAVNKTRRYDLPELKNIVSAQISAGNIDWASAK